MCLMGTEDMEHHTNVYSVDSAPLPCNTNGLRPVGVQNQNVNIKKKDAGERKKKVDLGRDPAPDGNQRGNQRGNREGNREGDQPNGNQREGDHPNGNQRGNREGDHPNGNRLLGVKSING